MVFKDVKISLAFPARRQAGLFLLLVLSFCRRVGDEKKKGIMNRIFNLIMY